MVEVLKYHIKKEKKKYLFFLFVFVLGMIIGGISIYFLSSAQLEELENYISSFFSLISKDTTSINSLEIFKNTFYTDLKIYLGLAVFGLTIFSIFYNSAVIFYKGFLLGFTNTFFIYTFGFKGILFALTSLIFQHLLKLIALLFAITTSLSFKNLIYDNTKLKSYERRKSKSPYYTRYFLYIILAFLINTIGIYIESYIVPVFVVFFSSHFL